MSRSNASEHSLVAAVFMCFSGMFFMLPFMPLYVQELGGLDTTATAVWAGAILGATPLVSALVAPGWGMLADRIGRRIMLQRSLLGFSICLGAMGLATQPWQLLAIASVQGVFGGFMASAAVLVSATSAPERLSIGIGRIQSARVLGMAVSPLPGGLVANFAGYRVACLVAMLLVFLAFLIVTIFTREPESQTATSDVTVSRPPLRSVVITSTFLSLFFAVLVTRMAERSFDPILPLLLAETVGQDRAALATSTVTTAGLIAGSISAALIGHAVKERYRKLVLLLTLLATAAAFAPIPLSAEWAWLLVWRVVTGLLLGVAATLVISIAASEIPFQRRTAALSVIGSAGSYGSFIGYMLAGVVSHIALSFIFVVDAVLLLLCALFWFWVRGSGRREL